MSVFFTSSLKHLSFARFLANAKQAGLLATRAEAYVLLSGEIVFWAWKT